MCRYKKIDLENLCRKEHYLYYTNSLNVEVNMTANIDVSELLTFCHTNGYKFYPTLIYCVTKVLNRIENFKMFKDKIFKSSLKSIKFNLSGLLSFSKLSGLNFSLIMFIPLL